MKYHYNQTVLYKNLRKIALDRDQNNNQRIIRIIPNTHIYTQAIGRHMTDLKCAQSCCSCHTRALFPPSDPERNESRLEWPSRQYPRPLLAAAADARNVIAQSFRPPRLNYCQTLQISFYYIYTLIFFQIFIMEGKNDKPCNCPGDKADPAKEIATPKNNHEL